jgi:hypothetical protein
MKFINLPFYKTTLLFLMAGLPFISKCQDDHLLNCADVRNGIFYFIGRNSDGQETFIRKGALQREIVPKQKETILWEVEWLNDCTYMLKYESGAENRSAEELKFLNKHIVVTEILHVTQNFLTFRTAFDKVTNPTVLQDTLWIKQRQSMGGKSISNPDTDSIIAGRMQMRDSLEATYATLYIFRPGKSLNCMRNYTLNINGEPACVIRNGCREILKLRHTGTYRISAKVDGPEQVVTIEAKPGESYYLQCMITWDWGLTSHPVLTVMDKTVGEGAFKTAEKPGLWSRE